MPGEPLRVAVVGSGPAGFYAAAALLAADPPAEVDLIERLPTPWGLVRLGVAPDHPNIKAVSRAFEKTAAQPGFRFFGNVEMGRDVTHEELTQLYDAVVYAVGAQTDRRLGIPGEDLPGSWAATEFVAWYNGHPDFQQLEFDLSHERAVVIGNGNVALDVARMLALTPEELATTDTTDPAIDAINGAGIRELLVVGRRGPVQAAWTPVEVGELGELAGADIVVDPADLELDPESEAELAASPPTVRRNVEHLRRYAATPPAGKPRVIRLRFFTSPVAILGDGKVEAIELARNDLVGGRAVQTEERETIACGWSSAAWATTASPSPASASTRAAAPSRTRAAVSSRASTPRAGSSAGRAASSARTRRTPPRRCSSCSRTPRPACSRERTTARWSSSWRRAASKRCSTRAGRPSIEPSERQASRTGARASSSRRGTTYSRPVGRG